MEEPSRGLLNMVILFLAPYGMVRQGTLLRAILIHRLTQFSVVKKTGMLSK